MLVDRTLSEKKFEDYSEHLDEATFEGGSFYEAVLSVFFEPKEFSFDDLQEYLQSNLTWESSCPCKTCVYFVDCKMFVDVSVFTKWNPKTPLIGTMKEMCLSEVAGAVMECVEKFYDNVKEYQEFMKYDNVKLPETREQFVEEALTTGGVQITLKYVKPYDPQNWKRLCEFMKLPYCVTVPATDLETMSLLRAKLASQKQ